MSSITERLGVQSFCFRGFEDNQKVAQMVRDLDLKHIELYNKHGKFDDPKAWEQAVKTYNDAGVEVDAIGVQTFKGDPAERRWFECAKSGGARYISAHFEVDSFHKAVPATAKLCEEYGVKIAIHCHGGYRFGGSPDVIQHLLDLGGPNIGLCLDTAWCMQIGPNRGNPVEWAETFADRLYGVHVKDFVFDRNAQWNDVIVGTGNLDLPAFLQTLEKNNFNGYIALEYEADKDNPVPALKQCVEQVRAQS